MQIANETVATFDYTLTDASGEVLDTSKGREPLAYVHGKGGIIPGLESELEGKRPGDTFQVTLEPERAYGPRDDRLVQAVTRDRFPADVEVEVGMRFQAETQQGARVVAVTAVDGEEVTLDANHPLAGETLHFDVKVREVREATPEELQHGHVHGPGGHQH